MPILEIIVLILFIGVVAFTYIGEAVLFSFFVYNKLRKRKRHVLFTKRTILLHLIAIFGIVCFCYGYFIESYKIEVNNIKLPTDKLKNTSFRILQFSDLHCDKRPANEKEITKIINDLKPDIIVFTGDAINRPSYLPVFKETMKNLEAPLGKFAVYGNWETGHWPGLDYYSQTGFEIMHTKTVSLEKNNETITISGLRCDKGWYADGLLKKLSSENYNVFLFHSPDLAKYIHNYTVDLYLCGHTHGGQIALPFYGAIITMSKSGKKYESGKYLLGKTILYINRGLGMDAYPPRIRFFAKPEITVFDIIPE
ncbi:MAG: metallophosphoesterase [Sedimentisphaerales bacterium]|nr:metallophosphoesterase [Sedimentisphaerales bacterium]